MERPLRHRGSLFGGANPRFLYALGQILRAGLLTDRSVPMRQPWLACLGLNWACRLLALDALHRAEDD